MNYRTTIISNLAILAFFLTAPIYAQTGIGTKEADINADLTLGSNDKGILINKVELESLDSPKPINDNPDELTVGIMVYNTNNNNNLKKGFYYWGEEKKWKELSKSTNVTNLIPADTRELSFVAFLQTKNQYIMPSYNLGSSTQTEKGPDHDLVPSIPMDELDYDYTPIEDGSLFLDYIIYSSINPKSIESKHMERVAANVFCDIKVENATANEIVSTGVIAISPFIIKDVALNVATGVASLLFPVKKGETYKIRMTAKETYALWQYPERDYDVITGEFVYSNISRSCLKITFLSNPR